jgi:transposase
VEPEHRFAAHRSSLPSDLTDAEWAIVEPMIPLAKHGGRKRAIDVREILNGIFYVLSTGCQWQALPTCHRRAGYGPVSPRAGADGRQARPRRCRL